MKERISSKRYYRIEFQNTSALALGSGKSERTDRDIMCDSRGKPYIPASALAGIYRTLFEDTYVKNYFGWVENGTNTKETAQGQTEEEQKEDSKLIIYDAVLKDDQYRISSRDGVGLDEWKTAKKGAKFDFEILEPGAKFITYIEQNKYEKDENVGDVIAKAWQEGRISSGGKNTRGLGKLGKGEVCVLEFSFADQKALDNWLDFRIYDSSHWENWKEAYGQRIEEGNGRKARTVRTINLYLFQKGPISIRSYTTKVNGERKMLDYEQLVYRREAADKKCEEIPVIPGTSWAGAFRHHMRKLNARCLESYFGEKAEKRSAIQFGESELSGGEGKIVSRNAIDRFTGGTVDGALYTEKMYYGGKTKLEITLAEGIKEEFLKCLAAAIADLHMGYLSVGGETAIGHGIFHIKEIEYQGKTIYTKNGKTKNISLENMCEDAKDIYREVSEALVAEQEGRRQE